MTRYAPATAVRHSQAQFSDLRPCGSQWRFFPNGGSTPLGPPFGSLIEALQWPELAERRKIQKPLDAPFAPLILNRRGVTGELALADIPTIIYSADPPGPRGLLYARRRDRMSLLMAHLGIKTWRFHLGRTLRGPDGCTLPYCAAHCADHAQFCRENDPPLLLFEDDAEPAFPCSHLVPPTGADRLHIGADRHGVSLSRLLALKQRKDWRRHKGVLWRPCNRDWYWIAGSLAYHCVLYLTKRCMTAIADYMPGKTGAVDAVVSELDGRFNVAAPVRCWFWQNDGHNGAWSYDYCPRDLRPRDYPPFPP